MLWRYAVAACGDFFGRAVRGAVRLPATVFDLDFEGFAFFGAIRVSGAWVLRGGRSVSGLAHQHAAKLDALLVERAVGGDDVATVDGWASVDRVEDAFPDVAQLLL